MATYVPGYKRYEREFEPFTPDFKFLDNVLSIRQDRYNTNYKQMNDLYGKIVYADLSREDTKANRDQYINNLIPKIEKVSGMDLSIGANVDAAKSLFTPFYEDDLIVRDLVNTSSYKSAMRTADGMRNSSDNEIREQWWATGVEALQYQMEDFINADKKDALNMAPPKYVPNANLFNIAKDYLKEQEYELKWTSGTGKNDKWVITGTNGERLIPTAYSDLQRSLKNDPRVADAYRIDAYVQSRRYAQQGVESGKFSTINEGRNAWAQNTIVELRDRAAKANPMIQKQYEDALSSKKSWEEYAASKDVTLSESDKEFIELSNADYERALLALRGNNETLERTTQVDQNTDYVNLVSSLLMSYNISDDLFAAAKNYSLSHGGVDSVKVNPYTKMKYQHKYNIALENYKDSLERKRLDDYNPALALLQKTNDIEKASTTSTRVDQDAVDNPIERNNEVRNQQYNALADDRFNFITRLHGLTADKKDVATLEITSSNGDVVRGTPQQVRAELFKRNDLKAIDRAYETASRKYNSILETTSGKSEYPSILAKPGMGELAALQTDIRRRQGVISQEEKLYGSVLNDTYKLLREDLGDYGKTLKVLEESGLPSPLNMDGSLKSEKQYAREYTALLNQGKIKVGDKVSKPTDNLYTPQIEYKIADYIIPKEDDSFWERAGKYQMLADTRGAGLPQQEVGRETNQDAIDRVAIEQFNKFKDVFNLALSGKLDLEVDKYPNYSSESFFRGIDPDEMTPGNLYTDRTYNNTWNIGTMLSNPDTRNTWYDFNTQWNQTLDKDKLTMAAGTLENLSDDDLLYKDQTANSMIEELIMKSKNVLADAANSKDGLGSSESKKFTYDLNYIQTKVIGDKTYAAYQFNLPRDFVKDFYLKGNKSGTGTINEKDIDAYQSIEFLVPQENDLSERKAGNFIPSWVQSEINIADNNMFEFDDYSKYAGEIKVYESDGIYYAGETSSYKDEEGVWKTKDMIGSNGEYFYPVTIDGTMNSPYVTKNNIDYWINNKIALLRLKFEQNSPTIGN